MIEAKQFDEARRHYEMAQSFASTPDDPEVLASWVCGELISKNEARAEELLQWARAHAPGPALTYRLLAEAARKKLSPKIKKRFDNEFKALLGGQADQKVARILLAATTWFERQEITYTGLKTHRAKY